MNGTCILRSRIYSRAATEDYRGSLLKAAQSCVLRLRKGRNVAVGDGRTRQHSHRVSIPGRPVCGKLFRGRCGNDGAIVLSKSNTAMRRPYVLQLWQLAVPQRRSTRPGSAIRVSAGPTNFNGGGIACLTKSPLQKMIARLSFRRFQPRSQWSMFHAGCA
jgi:hypothetical protein